ncbi:hypothetical protein DFH29DRAFT_935113 [Suillus ampliporus]|nr:hypothetical protein DFH29DRAFT_935113 [Suillus ampliporus]
MDCEMLHDCRQWVPYILPRSSRAHLFSRQKGSELYGHVKASGRPGWMANENDIVHPEFSNLHNHDSDTTSVVESSPSSSLATAVARHDVRSVTRQTHDTLHPRIWEGTFYEQELSFDNDLSQCNGNACGLTSILKHVSSRHLREYLQPASKVRCQFGDCSLSRPMRRDTILRHIREIHYGDKSRRKHLS